MATTQDRLDNEHLDNSSSDDIRQDIRGTRRDMDQTLDQLGDRLHPRHLLDDALDLFRGGRDSGAAHAAGDVGRSIAGQVKEHPLPALLVGAGLVWWMLDRSDDGQNGDHRRSYASDSFDREMPPITGSASPGAVSAGSALGIAIDGDVHASHVDRSHDGNGDSGNGIGAAVAGAASTASESLKHAGSRIADAGGAAQSAASAGLHGAGRGLRRGQRAAGRGLHEATDRFHEASEDHPLAVGGVFLALGLAAGLLLPRTEREDDLMGEAADEWKHDVQAMGENALERGKEAAAHTAGAALDEAEARGITPSNLAEKAGRVISEAVAAGKKAAKDEGISGHDLKEDASAVVHAATETAKEEGQNARVAAAESTRSKDNPGTGR